MNARQKLAKSLNAGRPSLGVNVPKGRRTQSKGGFQSTGVNRGAVKAANAAAQLVDGLDEWADDRTEQAKQDNFDHEYEDYLIETGQGSQVEDDKDSLFANWRQEERDAEAEAEAEAEREAFSQKLRDKRQGF